MDVQELAREIFYATALALDYLHRKLIVHMYASLTPHHSPAQAFTPFSTLN